MQIKVAAAVFDNNVFGAAEIRLRGTLMYS